MVSEQKVDKLRRALFEAGFPSSFGLDQSSEEVRGILYIKFPKSSEDLDRIISLLDSYLGSSYDLDFLPDLLVVGSFPISFGRR